MRVVTPVLCACVLVVTGGIRSFAQSPASGRASSPQPVAQPAAKMERVTGIGGFFFRAADPKALSEWYERHLGVTQTPASYSVEPWRQEAGWTVFAPFQADTKYLGRTTQQWMINFRVRDLDAMVAQLKGAGIAVDVDRQLYPNGRFARLQDPEGNPIQLWEPRNPSAPTTPDL
jgi:glyoxylase I family protein